MASRLQHRLGAELFEIKTKKHYPTKGFAKFFIGGMDASLRRKPKLLSPLPELDAYETVILATPTWAGTFCAPLRSLLSLVDLQGKHVYLSVCNKGGSVTKLHKDIRQVLGDCLLSDTVVFTDPSPEKWGEVETIFEGFCARIQAKK